jgi:hypothetical protein
MVVSGTMWLIYWQERNLSAIEVITTALAAGASVGMKETASAAVRDAYSNLKSLLVQRFADRDDPAAQALEADETEPRVWQTRLGGALNTSGAVDDDEVLAAARRLLALADAETVRTTHIDVVTNYGAVGGEFSGPVTFNQDAPVPPAPPATG